jgi:proteasome accessory factor A
MDAVRGLVRTRPGDGLLDMARDREFIENGGSLYYEALPWAYDGGLIEGATPECRQPGALLLQQRAQDRLLQDALPEATEALAAAGHPGTLSILKNCRDGAGHVYGTQENYEVEFARGIWLLAWRVGLVALVPLVLVSLALFWSMLVVAVPVAVVVGLVAAVRALRGAGGARADQHLDAEDEDTEDERIDRAIDAAFTRLGRRWALAGSAYEILVLGPPYIALCGLVRLVGYRPHRRGALGFLASRMIFSGAGTIVTRDGVEQMCLSERAADIRRLVRWTMLPADRSALEIGHLMKGLTGPIHGRSSAYARLFHTRQRLQLGSGDANLCQTAEYLKLGTTMLVLDMAEAGRLADAPMPRDFVGALHTIDADPTLRATVPLRGGGAATALELQRFYQRRAAEWLAEMAVTPVEAHEVVRLWGEVLDALESEPASLVGRVDWVTKRYLLETAGVGLSATARKKIDLRYHELPDGYAARLEAAGVAPALVTDAEIRDARTTPPADTPARVRGRLIRELADRDVKASVSWDSVRIGGEQPRVVRLEDYRR